MKNKKCGNRTSVFIFAGSYREAYEFNGKRQHYGKALAMCVAPEDPNIGKYCGTPESMEHKREESLLLNVLQQSLHRFCTGEGYSVSFSTKGHHTSEFVNVFETGEAEEMAKKGFVTGADDKQYKPAEFLVEDMETIQDIFQYIKDHNIDLRVSISPLATPQYDTVKTMVKKQIREVEEGKKPKVAGGS